MVKSEFQDKGFVKLGYAVINCCLALCICFCVIGCSDCSSCKDGACDVNKANCCETQEACCPDGECCDNSKN